MRAPTAVSCAMWPATAPRRSIGGNKIDRKGPVITVTTPASGAVYQLNQIVNAAYSCSDGGSGPSGCAGTVANLSAIDTSTLGSKTFVVNATDAVGNTSSTTVTYDVRRTLTAVGPAKVWVGLKNSDDVGLRLDLRAELLVNGAVAASGELNNVSAGSSGFNNAHPAVRWHVSGVRTGGHTGWRSSRAYASRPGGRASVADTTRGPRARGSTGLPIDSGAHPRRRQPTRDDGRGNGEDRLSSGARFDLALIPGSLRQSVDVFVNSSAACPARPFVSFGTWSEILP